jgi:uncharacterized membrane protein YeaQ/YmgE (transglycosylase-associated protein family)
MAVADVTQQYSQLTEREKKDFQRQAGLIPPPTGQDLAMVWKIVLGILGAVIVIGILLTYLLRSAEKDADVFVGFVSAALGAIIGLIAPSPAQ